MENSTLTGVVPAVWDAEAGERGLPERQIRSAMAELCSAIRSALDDERGTAEESLRRAAEILQQMEETAAASPQPVRGGLAPWQIRKVTSHIEAHLDRTIRNEELAALVRLNPSHFGRAFRNSFGEPPHEHVIRRRVERAQGLMLSTDASLSEIALNCGLADQSHLTRLFRRIAGQSPRSWRRARLSAPGECPSSPRVFDEPTAGCLTDARQLNGTDGVTDVPGRADLIKQSAWRSRSILSRHSA
jgi:AraC family transcriptional regulator